MATKIRLKRIGRRNRPFYRMVVMDSRNRRDGAAIEELGWYNPIDLEHSFNLKGERVIHWLSEGAIPTEAAHKLLRRAGIAHQWHLISQGLDEAQIEKEMKKWEMNKDDVKKSRSERAEKKLNEKEKVEAPIEEVVEEAPAEETPTEEVVEEAPVEETPTEEVVEETPTEEIVEEAPAEETLTDESSEDDEEASSDEKK
ncbi:MAG: 30S ribosomal protein S16 [Candidatus Marinimicrobia bacterium]|nr:30S ribosomal protein S16 [Candidatus Neomarinimicrobiota bacterium]MBT7515682.1 30S ribosomal protein S16 [Candidatus Neomarinimicrobiota bacterium]